MAGKIQTYVPDVRGLKVSAMAGGTALSRANKEVVNPFLNGEGEITSLIDWLIFDLLTQDANRKTLGARLAVAIASEPVIALNGGNPVVGSDGQPFRNTGAVHAGFCATLRRLGYAISYRYADGRTWAQGMSGYAPYMVLSIPEPVAEAASEPVVEAPPAAVESENGSDKPAKTKK